MTDTRIKQIVKGYVSKPDWADIAQDLPLSLVVTIDQISKLKNNEEIDQELRNNFIKLYR